MDTKPAALAAFEKHYNAWESNEKRMKSGYCYESTFVEMMREVTQEVLQVSTGVVPKSKNEKKKSKPV